MITAPMWVIEHLRFFIAISRFQNLSVSLENPKLDGDARQLCKSVLERLHISASSGKKKLEGAVLIFLPGYYEIQLMFEDLAPLASQYG